MASPIGPKRDAAPPGTLRGLDILPIVQVRSDVSFDQLADLCDVTGFYLAPGEEEPEWKGDTSWPGEFGKDDSVKDGDIRIISDKRFDRSFAAGRLVRHPAHLPEGVLAGKFLTDWSYRELVWMRWGRVEMDRLTFLVPPSFIANHATKVVGGERREAEPTKDAYTLSTADEWTKYLMDAVHQTISSSYRRLTGTTTGPLNEEDIRNHRNNPLSDAVRTSIEETLGISILSPRATMEDALDALIYQPPQEVKDALYRSKDPKPPDSKAELEAIGLSEAVQIVKQRNREIAEIEEKMAKLSEGLGKWSLRSTLGLRKSEREKFAAAVYERLAQHIVEEELSLDASLELMEVAGLKLKHALLTKMAKTERGVRKSNLELSVELDSSEPSIGLAKFKLTKLCSAMAEAGSEEWDLTSTESLLSSVAPEKTVNFLITRHFLGSSIVNLKREKSKIDDLNKKVAGLKKGEEGAAERKKFTTALHSAKKVHGQKRTALASRIIDLATEYSLGLDLTLEFFRKAGLDLEHDVLENMTKTEVGERRTYNEVAKSAGVNTTKIKDMERKYQATLIEPIGWDLTLLKEDVANIASRLRQEIMEATLSGEGQLDNLEGPLGKLIDALIEQFNINEDITRLNENVARLNELQAEKARVREVLEEGNELREKIDALVAASWQIREARSTFLTSVINIAIAAGIGPVDSIQFLGRAGLDFESEILRTMVVDRDSTFTEFRSQYDLTSQRVTLCRRTLERLFDHRRKSVEHAIYTEEGFDQLADSLRITPLNLQRNLLSDPDQEEDSVRFLREELGDALVDQLKVMTALFSVPDITEFAVEEEPDQFRRWIAEQLANEDTNPFSIFDEGVEEAAETLVKMRMSEIERASASRGSRGRKRGRKRGKGAKFRPDALSRGRGIIGR